ncbi:hypothetical protein [Desulfonauticus submarinus]
MKFLQKFLPAGIDKKIWTTWYFGLWGKLPVFPDFVDVKPKYENLSFLDLFKNGWFKRESFKKGCVCSLKNNKMEIALFKMSQDSLGRNCPLVIYGIGRSINGLSGWRWMSFLPEILCFLNENLNKNFNSYKKLMQKLKQERRYFVEKYDIESNEKELATFILKIKDDIEKYRSYLLRHKSIYLKIDDNMLIDKKKLYLFWKAFDMYFNMFPQNCVLHFYNDKVVLGILFRDFKMQDFEGYVE